MTTNPADIEPTDCPTADGMPRLGLGTWENTDPDDCATSVETALNMGYRHIDTAQAYGNEADVGDGIARADVDRDDIFLATKVWIDNLAPEDVKRTARKSLDDLGVDAVDLLYIHWPAREYDPEATLAAFDELVDDGVTKHVGVSNFLPHQLEEAADILDAPIFAHQYEMHPFLQQQEVLDTCDELDINVVAYSPLARGHVLDDSVLTDIADDHGASAAQVSLAWLRETGVTAIPKATGRDHIADNWASLDLSLSDDEIARIDDLDRGEREVDPGFGPWNQD